MSEPVLVRGRLVTPVAEIADGVVAVQAPTIAFVGTVEEWTQAHPQGTVPDPVGTVLPGLVDIHCHGGGGKRMTTSDVAEARAVAAHHALHGSTSLVASLVTTAPDALLAQIRALAPLVTGSELCGLHLEGPFLSHARCGAQAPEFLLEPDLDLVEDLLAAADGALKVMTIAPELSGAGEVATRLRAAGVTVALGHSDASYQVFRSALRALDGEGLVTHLGNGMPPFHHRAVGPVGAALAEAAAGRAAVELIGDGVHVDEGFVALAFATAASGCVVLVTDAMAAAGMPDGDYVLGSQQVTVRHGVARLTTASQADATASTIAGGTSHLVEVVAGAVHRSGVPLVDAVRAASQTPARILGVADERGALMPGGTADLLVTDAELRPVRVMRRGEWL
ncbi:MAG: N-acetylglucosamine-6-phosphate deacetylase [Actinomycetota bacterium]|nr:N-acetylglucosamine-6-phosphate deacetylase [Actinomycetota bacterium]